MNSCMEVSARIRPRPMTTRWSATSCISLIRCEDSSTVRPSAASSTSSPRIHWIPSRSRPLTGSSSMSTCGSASRAPAMPLTHSEREPAGGVVGHLGESDRVEDGVDAVLADADAGADGEEVVAGAAGLVDRLGIEQRTERGHRGDRVDVGATVDERPTRRGPVEAEDHPHGRRLAGTVGPEEPGDEPGAHVEADVVHGRLVAVDLGEVQDLDHGSTLPRGDLLAHRPAGVCATYCRRGTPTRRGDAATGRRTPPARARTGRPAPRAGPGRGRRAWSSTG